jgi:hypothetical protein
MSLLDYEAMSYQLGYEAGRRDMAATVTNEFMPAMQLLVDANLRWYAVIDKIQAFAILSKGCNRELLLSELEKALVELPIATERLTIAMLKAKRYHEEITAERVAFIEIIALEYKAAMRKAIVDNDLGPLVELQVPYGNDIFRINYDEVSFGGRPEADDTRILIDLIEAYKKRSHVNFSWAACANEVYEALDTIVRNGQGADLHRQALKRMGDWKAGTWGDNLRKLWKNYEKKR